ncbi:PAS domain-containing protein [Leptolyngbya sp. CCNP1308]|uniref:hybrid sensor histidine kinase/response regulator n=1 Tax=Leptolyngbya sp. CCNP1308 TaxID=3110255 RepID=UPI002B212A0B|nr:PAS domain-containing protein [Leptolyngbya sp. CCNP1308]MEA5451216.1 PAS domain-containing protein [Leptolyngbya sp. CCNP1308]
MPGQSDRYGQMLRYEPTACYRVVEVLGDGQMASRYQPAQIDGVLIEADGNADGLEGHGLDLLQQLQELWGTPCPPAIVIGEDDLKTAVAAFKAGAADYLVKDQLTPEGLGLALEAAMSGGSAGRIAPVLRKTQVEAAIAAPPQSPPGALVDALPHMVWMADRTGAVYYWNQCWYAYTGLSPADSAGLAGASCVHPQEYGPTLDRWAEATAAGQPFEIEHRIRRHDGVYRWFMNRGVPTRDRTGQITGWVGTVVDIDEHKRLEERFQLVVQAVNGLVFDASEVSLDGDDCVYRSEQLFDLIGVPVNEASPTSRWWEDRIHPDDRARLRHRMEELFASSSQLYESDYRVRHQDGRWVDVWERGCLVRDEQGRVMRVVGSTVDISQQQAALRDRNRAELRLQKAHIQLEAALAAGSVYTWCWNVLENRVVANRSFAQLVGLDPERVAAGVRLEKFINIIHADDQARVAAAIDQAIATGESCATEFRIGKPQGEERWVIARGRAEYDSQGRAVAFPGALADISDRKQAELRLQENEERFRTLADNISQFTWMTDATGWIFWYNQRWFDYTGTTFDAMQGWGWQQVHHPDHLDRVVSKFRHCLATGETWEDTFPLRSKDGTYRWFLSRAIPVRDEQGRVVRWFGTNTDITDLRQTELTLQQTTERLNIALKSAPISLFNQDLDLRYTWIYNPTQDLSVEQVIGQSDEDLASPETAARLTHLKRQVIATGIGLREEVKVVTNGQTAYYDLTIDPIHDAQNAIVGVTCAAVDISERIYIATEHQQAELALQESEDCLRMAIESARMGIWDWNLTTNRLTWDAGCKAIFGLSPEADSSVERFYEGLHPDDRDRLQLVIADSLTVASGGSYDVEYRVIGIQDRVERWVRAKGQTYFDRDDTPLRFIGTVLDITQQKQAEAAREQLLRQEQAAREAAERANRIKDEFLAILSHELRSPLNPILGWAKLLQTKKLDAAKTTRALETIERNAKLQTQLIDDLLDIAKILRGKLKIEPASVDPVFVIESAIETVQAAADAKAIRIESDLPDIGLIQGDGARIQQIVWNLLTNAIKFTPEQGQITIQLAQVDRWAQLKVTDTGRGICPKFLPHIFDSFRQADTSITRQFGGLGLGLAIVRYLAEAHGGTIAADSPGEGQGATFTVSLPLMSDRPSQRVAAILPSQIDLAGVRVIAVDDNPDGLALLTLLLGEYGAEVVGLESAAEVLTTLAKFKPHVLVSDIGMPEMDGYALIQQIRALPPEQGGLVPAIALTAYVREEDSQKAIDSGFQRHLAKPIEPDTIARAVAQLMQR